jgi:hypothetical protein
MYPTASSPRRPDGQAHRRCQRTNRAERLGAVGAVSSRKRETQPVLLQSHIEKRLAFARDPHPPDAEKILFSDEAHIYERGPLR